MFKKYQLRSYNFRLVILLIVTSVYGIAVINSADSSYTIKQCAGLLLSLFVMVVVSLIDYNWLLRFYWIMYALNFVQYRTFSNCTGSFTAGSHCTDFNAAKSFNNHFAGINFVYHYILCRLKLPDYGHCFIVYSACHHYSGYLYQ